jgi:membrane protease YdiL (CAAX protease family)
MTLAATRLSAWPALLAYLVSFVVSLIASAIAVAVPVWHYRSFGPSRFAEELTRFAMSASGLIAVATTNAAVLLALTALFSRLSGRSFVVSIRLGPSRMGTRSLGATLAGMLGLSFACASAVELAGARNGSVMHVLAEGLHALPWGLFTIALLGIAVAPGVAEEAFFRGFFQTRVAAAWGRRTALFVSAGAFAIMHIDPAQAAVAFVGGAYLGWIADRARSVRPTMLAHALNNGVFVVFARFGTEETTARATSVLMALAGLLVFAAAIAVIVREAPSGEAR